MNVDGIQQRLALVPQGLRESNIESWKKMVEFFEGYADMEISISELLPKFGHGYSKIYELVREFSINEQAKLFRAGQSVYDLLISTTDRHGLKSGEPFVRVFLRGEALFIQYEIGGPITDDNENPNVQERKSCNSEDDLMPILQPMLDRLWNETREKHGHMPDIHHRHEDE